MAVQQHKQSVAVRLVRGASVVLVLLASVSVSGGQALTAYGDQLENGFADWSWAVHDLAETAVVHSGSAAISFEPDGWSGLYLHRADGIAVPDYDAIELWINGGVTGGQAIRIAVLIGGVDAGDAPLAEFVTGGVIPVGAWAKARIPFATLGVTSGVLDGFWLQADTGANQAAVYVDDIVFTAGTAPPPTTSVSISVDPSAEVHPIDPRIYGVNFCTASMLARAHYPLCRWGGNSTTRYSWQDDISNRASDWFFMNIEEENSDPSTLPDGSAADRFIDTVRAGGAEPIITLPTIGWTPIDRTRRWGFSVVKYGAQQATECTATGYPDWCQPDAGNGVHVDGTPITGNDPHDTSREVGPDFDTAWMAHIASRVGTAAAGGVRLFALDNEPELWSSTHRDVHPAPLTYDELWQRTSAYAAAVKQQDAGAVVLGPVPWGWCAYFFSAADGCSAGADAAAHGGLPILDWYLKQVHDYQTLHGVRLVDTLDIHYYPQGSGIALSDDESAGTAARRLRSVKSLYDPGYVDESWIGQPVRLIPRMKEWIAARAPGTSLAITEYNWGGDDGLSSALAQAEVLGVFAREGVQLATRWVAPAEHTRVEDAFLLYLNYDGAGGNVRGDSVRAVSSDVDAVGAYAVRGDARTVYLVLVNKATSPVDATVTFAGGFAGSASLFRFDATQRLGAAGQASVDGGTLALTLPARSATLAVAVRSATGVRGDADGSGAVNVADVFYLINAIFAAGPPPTTLGGDADGDGTVDVADVFYLINHLFAGGPPPPP